MASASVAVQRALLDALSGDAGLIGIIGAGRVFDRVPPRTSMPYVSFGNSVVRDWSGTGAYGEEHIVVLHAWSRGGGRREVHEIMHAIRAALHEQALALSGYRLINLRHEVSEARRDTDGETYQGIMRLRAVVEPN